MLAELFVKTMQTKAGIVYTRFQDFINLTMLKTEYLHHKSDLDKLKEYCGNIPESDEELYKRMLEIRNKFIRDEAYKTIALHQFTTEMEGEVKNEISGFSHCRLTRRSNELREDVPRVYRGIDGVYKS